MNKTSRICFLLLQGLFTGFLLLSYLSCYHQEFTVFSLSSEAAPEVYSGEFQYTLYECDGKHSEELNFLSSPDETPLKVDVSIDLDQVTIKRSLLHEVDGIWNSKDQNLFRLHGLIGVAHEEDWSTAQGTLEQKESSIEGRIEGVKITHKETRCKLNLAFIGNAI